MTSSIYALKTSPKPSAVQDDGRMARLTHARSHARSRGRQDLRLVAAGVRHVLVDLVRRIVAEGEHGGRGEACQRVRGGREDSVEGFAVDGRVVRTTTVTLFVDLDRPEALLALQ